MGSSSLTASVVLLDATVGVDREADVCVTFEPRVATHEEVDTKEVFNLVRHSAHQDGAIPNLKTSKHNVSNSFKH